MYLRYFRVTGTNICILYTGWPRKNATLAINDFKKTRDRNKQAVFIIAYTILFPTR